MGAYARSASCVDHYLARRTRANVQLLSTARPSPRGRPRDASSSDLVDRRHRVRREPVQNALLRGPRLDAAAPTARLTQAPLLLRPFRSVASARRLELDVDALDDACCFEIDEEASGRRGWAPLHVLPLAIDRAASRF